MIKTKCLFAPVEESDGTRIIISGIPKEYPESYYDESYSELAPTKNLLYAYKYHGLSWEEYEVQFFQVMKGRRAQRRIKELAERSNGGEVITLLCYEKTDEKCHRRLLKNLIEESVRMDRKRLFVIDGYLLIYRAYCAPIGTTLTSSFGEPTNATYIFTASLLKLIREQKPDALVVAMEGRCKPFRNDLYNEYKANRIPPSGDFITQRNRIEEILAAMYIPVLRVDGFEADDIIGTVSKKGQQDGYEVFICSTDKDMLQLIDHSISMFNMKTGRYTNVDSMIEQTGVVPSRFIDYLALQGDPGDNVPGIPGVGPKTAAQWVCRYGSVENLLVHIHADEVPSRHRDNLKKFKDRLLLSKKLVTIECDVPVEIDYNKFALKEFDKDKLRDIFTELGFSRLIVQLGLNGE